MAQYKDRTPMSIKLVEDLASLVEVPDIETRDSIHVDMILDASLRRIKEFFRYYYLNKDDYWNQFMGLVMYNVQSENNTRKKKIEFWNKFSDYILANEIEDKPEEMSEEDFLFEVKFKEYSYSAKIELTARSWSM